MSERTTPPRSLPYRIVDRMRRLTLTVNVWLFTANAWVYAAAGSFIGFETVALWLSFIALWPVVIPVMLAGIAVVGVLVRRIRERRDARR
jgi:hypothetical protein